MNNRKYRGSCWKECRKLCHLFRKMMLGLDVHRVPQNLGCILENSWKRVGKGPLVVWEHLRTIPEQGPKQSGILLEIKGCYKSLGKMDGSEAGWTL